MSPEENGKNDSKTDDGFEVLKVFGLKLKVKDSKIADLLTTDVKEDVSTFREKLQSHDEAATSETVELATVDEIDSHEKFQEAINIIGNRLEFDVGWGGIWRSPTGVAILLKPIFDHPSLESAKQDADDLSHQQSQIKTENAALFVTRDSVACDILKAAIRSKNLYHLMRVVSYENLYGLLQLKDSGYLKHRQVVTLMVPLDNVDVGELLNIVKAVAAPTTLEDYLKRKQP